MSQPRFRHFPLFINGRKFGEAHGNSYNAESGDEVQYGSDGILGMSDGIPNFRIEADFVQPVSGTKIDLWDFFLNKKEFQVGQMIGGKQHLATARIVSMSLTSESKTGTANGKITIQCTSTVDVT